MLEFALEYQTEGFHLAPALTAGRGVTALYGPSGAGKSLTLLCLAGLLRPRRGTICLNGRLVYDAATSIHVPPHRRRVAIVFQEYALFPHLSVRANLAYGLRRAADPEIASRVDEMLRLLRLEEFRGRHPGELSGGQRQRVALGRALIVQPELLLLDEPFSALDQMERERLRGEVLDLLRGFGGTTILVTHSLEEAYVMADQIAVIDAGRILQAGPRDDILQQPRDRRVAELVGASNIVRGVVQDVSPSDGVILWHGHRMTVAGPLPPVGSRLECCIRPEHVRLLWPERAADRANVVSGRLTAEIKRGVDYVLRFRGDGEVSEAGEIDIQCSEHLHYLMRLHPGKPVWISLPPDKLHPLLGP